MATESNVKKIVEQKLSAISNRPMSVVENPENSLRGALLLSEGMIRVSAVSISRAIKAEYPDKALPITQSSMLICKKIKQVTALALKRANGDPA
ncbi:hypothetical protein [Microbulbifer aggregans]|uniref:hypothetical protein n=1 Tax=Microbulbifer aggregans TaxID=1769779 RepID=UPI001CFF0E3F|nr:hypothetical protein [Microbulbifer aggregans]